MLDHSETDDTVAASGEALRNAEYASLTRRAATDNSRALVNEVVRLISETETRKRHRVSRADAFKHAVESFLADLLAAKGDGWVYRPTGHSSFTAGDLSPRTVTAVRDGLKILDLLEEMLWQREWGRTATRFRATPQLKRLAAQYGVLPSEVEKHFVLPLPLHPLLLKGASTWKGGDKIAGKMMEIAYTDKVTALERTIIELNDFLDGFDIRGGTHRGYFREFHCGDLSPGFDWNLGGRLYSQGGQNYQRLSGADRLKMTINGQSVCEVDAKASTLTIFHAINGQPLNFLTNPDPYRFRELSITPREVVKKFITTTFGNGQFPVRWPQDVAEEYRTNTGQSLGKRHPISQVRDAVRNAYPLLAELRRDDAQAPIWARLMYLESEAVLGTMLALQAEGVPSLSVHDSLVVPLDNAELARDALQEMYRLTTGTASRVIIHYPEQ